MGQLEFISIDKNLSVSKYKQIINSILYAISIGRLAMGDKMPSINEICDQFKLSRDTVLTAYNELKSKGIISAHPGKAYYVTSTNVNVEQNIMLLYDELNAFKEELYNAFIKTIGGSANVDLYFHNFNRKIFNHLLQENKLKYTAYIVMPAQFTGIASQLRELNGKVYILDQLPIELRNSYPAIYQNFEKQVFDGLMEAKDRILKYRKFISVYPGGKEPESQLRGFVHFCKEARMPFEVVNDLAERVVKPGEVYLVVNDSDLVDLVKMARRLKLRIGTDIGIISLNDTPLKEVVANGITTISTDFCKMGETLANFILNKETRQVENPFSLIIRDSL
jgi:DNA-binding transcriptional regulator YhcF (GntR family)